ncbi:zinc finger protein GAI-ASSOCIATED FACTOR 1 [Spinacia oleracea]|uniref:Zinc finger protein GAI-ASSOCIATED FACTOR 1 n=1 Tax=Spinacia oleracea TaxID=3562 RepID=A0A9R0HYW7_SPIOL|nr:zinc finger protein GAI-ASSOCIATED FACTOR 1-like [Spinacia oleracea]
MPADLDDSSSPKTTMSNTTAVSGEAASNSVISTGDQSEPLKPPLKKKRNQPGMPDPDAEVIVLSPKTLMATNRFVCEICNKGFQRDQNLQLHRRGHNLPWKLRQRSSKEVKKRVYVCPEVSCVHHDPSRALGDLTGIKKHYSRKHGEKKWKCEKCSKKYAVQSDWKAHIKICGTREYKCDCGTLFSRRDSFITHRAFCDALAEESARNQPLNNGNKNTTKMEIDSKTSITATAIASPPPPPPPQLPPTLPPVPPVLQQQQLPPPSPLPAPRKSPPPAPPTTMVASILPIQSSVQGLPENPIPVLEDVLPPPPPPPVAVVVTAGLNVSSSVSSSSCSSSSGANTSSSVFATLFASSSATPPSLPSSHPNPGFSDFIQTMTRHECPPPELPQHGPTEPISLCLSSSHGSSIFGPAGPERRQYAPPPQPAMSATALLQKAAQMGANGGSLLRGLGLVSSTSSTGPSESLQWTSRQIEPDHSSPVQSSLGLGLPCDEGSGLKELMIGNSSMFGPKQPTLDFLGLGMAAGGSPNGGLSALITSMGNGLDVAAAAAASFRGTEFSGKDTGRNS